MDKLPLCQVTMLRLSILVNIANSRKLYSLASVINACLVSLFPQELLITWKKVIAVHCFRKVVKCVPRVQ